MNENFSQSDRSERKWYFYLEKGRKMKMKTVLVVVITLALNLLLVTCAFGAEKQVVSDPDFVDYADTRFTGTDPWGGDLTVTIKSITDGKMNWTFTDSFDDSTLYQEMKDTVVKDNTAAFDIQGNDAQNKNTSFQYQGTMELKDGTVVMIFESGAVKTGSQTEGSSIRIAEALADEGLSNQVTLEKSNESETTTYTVQAGDSIHSIAKQFGISTKDLAIMNQNVIIETAQAHGHQFDDVIEYAKYLFPGEVLVVPAVD